MFFSTSTMGFTSDWEYTPTTWWVAPAGFASGPRALKMVLIPSCRLAGIAFFIDGWYAGAKRKQNPLSRIAWQASFGPRSIGTPNASRQSALPEDELTERLPCLATLYPAPARTNATAVEMLKVDAPSPPVPQVSTRGSQGISTGMAFLRMTLAALSISLGVSPF